MKNKILKGIIVSAIVCMIMQTSVFAGSTLPETELPAFNMDTVVFDQDGHVKFIPPTITTPSVANPAYKWKQFHIELLKRTTTLNSAGVTVFTWKRVSTEKVKADENEADLKISSVGYYQVAIRGEELNGNYSVFTRQDGSKQVWNNTSQYLGGSSTYGGVEIDEDHIGAGGSSSGGGTSGGSNVDINGGPGVVQSASLPIQGYQYAIIGPNGQIMGYFGGNQSYNGYANMNQYSQNSSQYYGPAYTNNMQGGGQTLYPNTGISNYPTVQAPNVYGSNGNYGLDQYNQQYNQQYSGQYDQQYGQQYNNQQSSIYNPNYSTANNNYTPGNNNSYMAPQITQGLEIGWHVDQNGRFYYQGNGVVLKSTWYLIDGKYFRFGDNGYLLANQWFKDQSTGSWYFLAGDGAMLTGWQNLNGVWYYFKPENGNGYGTMYSNTTLSINDPTWGYGEYAFDVNGAMVKNAWFGGHYYGNDGRRQN